MARARWARAVKGGGAEASDVSAPSLEGPGHHSLDTMELAGREPAGLDAPCLRSQGSVPPATVRRTKPGEAPPVQVCASKSSGRCCRRHEPHVGANGSARSASEVGESVRADGLPFDGGRQQ